MNVRKLKFIVLCLTTMLLLSGCSLFGNVKLPPAAPPGNGEPEESPDPVPTPKPTETTDEVRAKAILQNMTRQEKIGQLFFVRLRKDQAFEDIKNYHLGGLILVGNDFVNENKTSIKNLITSYQTAASIPMLIGVDEEGGTVNRLSMYLAFRGVPFHSPMDLYNEGGFALIRSDTLEKAELLLSLGINVNLAPVCDVSTDPNDFIYARSFGKDAAATSAYVKAVVEVMAENKLGCALKHFPGYGNNSDTHTGAALDERAYQTFITSDFLPFEAGIKAGAGSIMVSHNIITSVDQEHPASLSAAIHEILRKDLGFTGVVMTDDLSMDAIKGYTGVSEAAVLAIQAGNDLLIATNFEQQIPAVLAAVEQGTISESRIDESVIRILEWKLALGVIK